MKKITKISLTILGISFIVFTLLGLYVYLLTKDVKLQQALLNDNNYKIVYLDCNLDELETTSNGVSYTSLNKIPSHVQKSFIAIEDKRFYTHKGIDHKAILRAVVNNVKSFSYKEGGSTISQQLIKNTHLTNEKTLKRKIAEIKLSKILENKYSKDEILEMYLNTIYFGQGCYGITSASKFYFDKEPNDLNINEGATLAGIIKAPSIYSPINEKENCINRRNIVLSEMLKEKYISQNQYDENIVKDLETNVNNSKNSLINFIQNDASKILDNLAYKNKKFYIYTTINNDFQKEIENQVINKYDNSMIIIDKEGKIKAFQSTTKNNIRQLGSLIKPLLVYAPSIEENLVYSCTKINDEPINYNGYTPKNFNNKYYGEITIKKALSTSSNTVSVKLLNDLGIDKAKKYINKTGINLNEKDNSLALALGATEKGYSLKDITSSYSVFLNQGNYKKSYVIDKIIDENNKLLYKNIEQVNNVFSKGTIDVVNDMLYDCASNGTAKKLKELNFPVYAKTGTVGTKQGNTDCYSIAYTNEYIIGSWIGNKNNVLIENNVTGGGLPTTNIKEILKNIYNNKKPSKIQNSSESIIKEIDSITFKNTGEVLLAENFAPKRYVEEFIFKKSNVPKITSNIFSNPKIENPIITVFSKGINIRLCLPQYIEAIIYKDDGIIKKEVYNTLNSDKTSFNDFDIKAETTYHYQVVPYTIINGNINKGNEINLPMVKIDLIDWIID